MYKNFYFPDRVKYGTPEQAGLPFEAVFFESADGTLLSGWFIPAIGPARGTVVHMHGNAQNMGAHFAYVAWLPERGYNVFVFDYRGYGQSRGAPDPQGLFEDAVAALDHVRARAGVDAGKLCVFGQSLGGMIAIAAAGASGAGVCAVVAEAPFHSYTALADDQMPAEQLVLDDTYCATTYVARLAPTPLLLIHGTRDRIVPYAHSTMLLAEAGQPARLETIEGGEHNDAMSDRHDGKYRDMMVAFFDAALAR